MNIQSSFCIATALSLVIFSNSSALEVSGGVKLGLNLTKFYSGETIEFVDEYFDEIEYDPYESQVIKPGFAIGAVLQLKLKEMFAIQPEINFSAKGQKLQFDDYTQIISVNYLEIPVLFQLLFPARIITPTLYAGPSFAFKIGKVNGREGYVGEGENWTDEIRDYTDRSVNGFDFGFAMGGSIGIKAGPGDIIIDARYTIGLIKVFKLTYEMIEEGITEEDIENRNSALSFEVGYLFNL
jgi:hypothetical protein